MRVRIFYFANLREERGCSEEERDIAEGQTLFSLFVAIFGREPIGIRFAVNQSYVDAHIVPFVDDEIAFLPPLGGG